MTDNWRQWGKGGPLYSQARLWVQLLCFKLKWKLFLDVTSSFAIFISLTWVNSLLLNEIFVSAWHCSTQIGTLSNVGVLIVSPRLRLYQVFVKNYCPIKLKIKIGRHMMNFTSGSISWKRSKIPYDGVLSRLGNWHTNASTALSPTQLTHTHTYTLLQSHSNRLCAGEQGSIENPLVGFKLQEDSGFRTLYRRFMASHLSEKWVSLNP